MFISMRSLLYNLEEERSDGTLVKIIPKSVSNPVAYVMISLKK